MTTSTPVRSPAQLADALVRLTHLVQHVFADASRRHDMTPQHAQLLCLLTERPLGMSELCRLLHLEKSSVTGLVDRVQRRGLVARARDEDDRRACRVQLTDEGSRLADRAHASVAARLDELAADLSAADRAHLADALTRVVAAAPDDH
ncbi:MAG: MarR family transcriptional regulator [Streptosporangiales bacterium]|nr:MarR family transcriptional regulator [Streptosporangiales bacterium]